MKRWKYKYKINSLRVLLRCRPVRPSSRSSSYSWSETSKKLSKKRCHYVQQYASSFLTKLIAKLLGPLRMKSNTCMLRNLENDLLIQKLLARIFHSGLKLWQKWTYRWSIVWNTFKILFNLLLQLKKNWNSSCFDS